MLELTPVSSILIREQYYIDLYKASDRLTGYNISKIPSNTIGTKRTESSKLKMSLAKVKSDRVKNLQDQAINSGDPYLNGIKNMGKNNKNSKPVFQCDTSGNILKEWDSAGIAAKTLGLSLGNIWMCCNGKYKTSYGFFGKYKNNIELQQN